VLLVGADEIEDGLISLAGEYVDQGRGFVLRRVGGGWRMYTDPGAAEYVEAFVLHGRSGRLSQAALETLAIIAYKQPVTRGAISEIRGVDADAGVRNLLNRGLVEEVGREETPGQPTLYGTTSSFLEKLGLDSLADLPALPDLSPGGPPPPEPSPGGYKAARKELAMLREDSEEHAAQDAEIEDALSRPTQKPGARLTALLADPYGEESEDDPAPGASPDINDTEPSTPDGP
jgi:segregation and condensation protein B